MLNRSILIGRLTRDPEMRYTPSGVAVTQFTLAVDNPFKNDEPKADFIPIVVWRQQAEAAANYLRKGRLCAVEGRIQTRNYENNEGRRIYVTEVVADNVRFLERAEGAQSGANGSGGQTDGRGSSNATGGNTGGYDDPFKDSGSPLDISEDDLPF